MDKLTIAGQINLVAASDLLDESWYRTMYRDVADSGMLAAEHYVRYGWRLDRSPGPGFSTFSYLAENPDVDRMNICPLVHYILSGQSEGRPVRAVTDLPTKDGYSQAMLPVGGGRDTRTLPGHSDPPGAWPRVDSAAVDVAVCVHNALDDVRRCLSSVLEKTPRLNQLIVVNDGSSRETTDWLRAFVKDHPDCLLLENEEATGYTKAANLALRSSKADAVVLLNSDTMVSSGWLEGIVECLNSDANIGIVGPLSNAASWQSVPSRFSVDGEWDSNPLPPGYEVDDLALAVSRVSLRKYPRVPFVNGFCFAVKRSVIDRIGLLDEESFPFGYGEENDFCIRASAAGFSLVIADDVYIFHAKSKSYSHDRRKVLSAAGSRALRVKHGDMAIDYRVKQVRQQRDLLEVGQRLGAYLEWTAVEENRLLPDHYPDVLFLLPVRGGGGGTHSVIQEVVGMRQLGVRARAAVRTASLEDFKRHYPQMKDLDEVIFFYRDDQQLIDYAISYDLVIATVYHSNRQLKQIISRNPDVRPGYYVQDYEPWFFEVGSDDWLEAFESYTTFPDTIAFAKTDWICNQVLGNHDVSVVHKVRPSLDTEVYNLEGREIQTEAQIVISAMIRPATPRRNPELTMRVLARIHEKYGSRVNTHTFGCSANEMGANGLDLDFPFEIHGQIPRERVAELLRESHVFLDFSTYQAFGRTGLEAMACGCTAVMPVLGGVHEFAQHRSNSLLVDTGDEEVCYTAVCELIDDPQLLLSLRIQGVKDARGFSVIGAVESELELFSSSLASRRPAGPANHRPTGKEPDVRSGRPTGVDEKRTPWKRKSERVSVSAIMNRTGRGDFAGSSYVRLIQPFASPEMRHKYDFRATSMSEITSVQSGLIVVQRTAITRPEDVERLLDLCRTKSLKLVFEIDDKLWDLPDESPERERYAAQFEVVSPIVSAADLVTVSSDALKQSMISLNRNLVVVPNALDAYTWNLGVGFEQRRSPRSGQLRILYMGTRTHASDFEMISDQLRRLKMEYPHKVEIDVIGLMDEGQGPDWLRVIRVPDWARRYPHFAEWICAENRWDVGIAPLHNNPFNECKSAIKFLEYAALGLTTVASSIPSYVDLVESGNNGYIVEREEDWFGELERLLLDDRILEARRVSAWNDLLEKRSLSTQWHIWDEAYGSV